MGFISLLIAGLWAHLAGWSPALVVFIKPTRNPCGSRQLSDRVLTDNGGSEVVLELMFGVPPSRERSGTLGEMVILEVDAPSKKQTNMEAKNDGVEHEFPLKKGVMFRFHVGFWAVYVLLSFLWRS